MQNLVRRFLLSVSFLTILPFHLFFSKRNEKEQIQQDLSKASVFFPLIGLMIGAVLAGLYKLLQFIPVTPVLVNGLILTVWIVLSGGLHLEGFADMVDGFSGGKNREDIIRIMKDGAVGAKGAIALVLLILLKFLLLHSAPNFIKIETLLLAPVIGRWAMVLSGYWGKPASSENTLTKMFTLYLGKKELFIATLLALAFASYFLSYQSIYFFLFAGVLTRSIIVYSYSKMQGICGDVIGAINEMNEMCFLFVFILFET